MIPLNWKNLKIIRWYEQMPMHAKGIMLFLIGAVGFSFMVACIKWMGQTYNVFQILFIRQLIMVAFVVRAFSDNPIAALKTDQLGLQFIRIASALIAMSCGFTAIIHMDLATATAIGFSKAFFITIFAIFILGEVVGIRRWSAVVIGFLGVYIMLRPSIDGVSFYEILAIIGSAGAGLAMVCIRKLTRTEKPITILAYQAFFVGLAITIPAIYFWKWPEFYDWLVLITIGVIGYFAQRFNIIAYKYSEASLLGVLDYGRIIYATLIGIFWFNEIPNIYTFIGAAIIILSTAYTINRERIKKKTLEKTPIRTGL
jgi:drug/metabolite transporter (DMT)-like permease